ncbi:hypothetical protein [Amycolatopsis sp. NBC_01480]|uniref:hypothetical protein n=1 Tax=Amycolatopsis sp. NBC_01480 TaxID=2903562 RepID=UPI002E2B3C56|nr:hypothetical protein [Amycolatopsis sp. NBC_01480]
MEAAAKICREVVTDGWQKTVAGRATDYITTRTWKQVFTPRGSRLCRALAQMAAETLAYKKKLHSAMGAVAAWLIARLGGGGAAQAVARDLTASLPLPVDAKFAAVARGVQLTGILVCVYGGRDLTHCPCFIDLALNETKDRVKKILTAAVDDWANLARFGAPPQPASTV